MAGFNHATFKTLKKGDQFLFPHSEYSSEPLYQFDGIDLLGRAKYFLVRKCYCIQHVEKKVIIKEKVSDRFLWKLTMI